MEKLVYRDLAIEARGAESAWWAEMKNVHALPIHASHNYVLSRSTPKLVRLHDEWLDANEQLISYVRENLNG